MSNKIQNSKLLIILDQMIVSGCNFSLGILLARYLGLDQFGIYSLLWLAVLFMSSIQLAFITTPLLTFGAKKKGLSSDVFLSNMLYFQMLCATLLVFLMYGFFKIAPIYNPEWNIGSRVYIILPVTFSFLLQDFLRRFFIIRIKYFFLILLDTVAYIGQIVIISYLVFFDEISIENVFVTLLVTFSFSALLGLLNLKFLRIRKRYFRTLLYKNWKFSKWLVYSAILQWGSGNYFILAAGSILGVWAVGVIKIMQNIMGLFHVLFLAFENILPINFSKIFHKEGLNNLLVYSKKFILYGLVGFFFLIISVYPFSDDLITFFYGYDKAKYAYLLIWFLIIYLFIFLGMVIRYILRTIDNTKIIFYGYVVNLIFSLTFSSILIEFFGITGVAIGMLAIQVIMNLMMYSVIGKRKKILLHECNTYSIRKS